MARVTLKISIVLIKGDYQVVFFSKHHVTSAVTVSSPLSYFSRSTRRAPGFGGARFLVFPHVRKQSAPHSRRPPALAAPALRSGTCAMGRTLAKSGCVYGRRTVWPTVSPASVHGPGGARLIKEREPRALPRSLALTPSGET